MPDANGEGRLAVSMDMKQYQLLDTTFLSAETAAIVVKAMYEFETYITPVKDGTFLIWYRPHKKQLL